MHTIRSPPSHAANPTTIVKATSKTFAASTKTASHSSASILQERSRGRLLTTASARMGTLSLTEHVLKTLSQVLAIPLHVRTEELAETLKQEKVAFTVLVLTIL